VIVPDLDARAAEARRVFMDVFCPDWRTRHGYELPVNFSYGEPLDQQPRVTAALNLLHLLKNSVDYQRFSLALRTPFLGGGRKEAGPRALLDLRLRDRLGARFAVRDAKVFAEAYAPGFGELLVAVLEAGSDTSHRTPAAWAQFISGLLEAVQWPGDESLDSVAHQELEAWHELLREFTDCSRICGEIDREAALVLLGNLAAVRLYQPEAGSGVVQVMGILEAAGHEFDRLWVTGMAAEDWPRPATLNPLLPFGLQRRCGMPRSTPQLELEYAAALITRLRHSSPETVFSWAAMRDGKSLHVSDLISGIPQAEAAGGWHEPLWRDGMFGSAAVDTLDDDRPQAWQEGARAGGGTALFRLQATCPFRAFLELRLGAKEIDEPVTGIGYKQRGSLAHRVLEDFYRLYRSSKALAGLTKEELADCLNELLAKRMRELPGMRRPFMRTVADLETQRILPQLIEFIFLDQERGEFEVLQSEEDEEVTVGPLRVGLKLDRLDRLADGSLLVVDYKTGQVAKGGWNPGKPGDMQLPVYATFVGKPVSGIAFAQLSAHDVQYDGLADTAVEIDGLISVDRLHHKFTDGEGAKLESWEALVDAWRACLLSLADEFADGNCSINPKHDDLARGQFAVLTRVCELPGYADEDGNNG
jgi:probable DNA repair protein